jgi:hypothetical protein
VRSFLLISPLFPPNRHIGAKRALHLVRHLPAAGWMPAAVTLPAELDADPALVGLAPEVPRWTGFRTGPIAWMEDRVGFRPRRRHYGPARRGGGRGEQGRVAVVPPAFDVYTRYFPWTLPGALRFARRERCEAIYAIASPTSSILLGMLVARVSGLPLVVDLRDPWSIEPNYRAARTRAGQALVERLEAAIFGRARAIVLNTESARAAYVSAYAGRIPEERFATIRNSFDPGLYDPPPPPPGPEGPLHVVYYGNLRPAKSAVGFLRGLRLFVERQGLGAADVQLTTLGERTPDDEEAIAALGLGAIALTHDWVPFTRSRALLGRADVLLDLMGPGHSLQISGKLYDYLAAGRPVLSVAPNRELDAIFTATRAGRRIDDTPEAIAAALTQALTDKRAGRVFTPDAEAVASLRADRAAARVAAILEEVTRAA